MNAVMQNPEESVTFDTVPNVKKEHEVNVGMFTAFVAAFIDMGVVKLLLVKVEEDDVF